MSLVDGASGGLSAADVAAVTRNNGGNGFGWGGDGSWWLIVLFLFALSGNGWGNGFGGNGVMPYMMGNTQSDVQRGFDQSAVMSGLNGINTAVANGFANAEVSRCNGQLATLQAINTLGYNQQNCCCENRLEMPRQIVKEIASWTPSKLLRDSKCHKNLSFRYGGLLVFLEALQFLKQIRR